MFAKRIVPLVLTGLCFSSGTTMAQSALEMRSWCAPVVSAYMKNGTVKLPQDFDTGYCWGAFRSIQLITGYVDRDERRILGLCLPPEIKLSQIIMIFSNYVEQHPKEGHKTYESVALDALHSTFPCEG